MKWFTKKNKNDVGDEIIESDMEECEFKPFHRTYKMITFALSAGMMYPNPETHKIRFILIVAIMFSIVPPAGFILLDMYECIIRRDIIEMIRHSTIIGPFLGAFLKMFLMLLKRDASEQIIDEINRDYSMYNDLPETEKPIIRSSLRNNLIYSEKCWAITVFTCVMTFPLMSSVLNLYNFIFKSEPQKFMIHEVNKPFSEPEERYESPYFEIMYVYMFYCACLYVVNFLGYDGFYGIAINHTCLKITMYCRRLNDAMQMGEKTRVAEKIAGVIEEQNRTFRLMEHIQDTFNIWLGIIFIATMIQLSNLLYHISAGYGFDLRYMIFISGVTIHIYLPCHYAAKLKTLSLQAATEIYCCGWENVHDQTVRKMLSFMIARAQIPCEITALNMVVFDMELFVSILQTSYSIYTLLSS